MGILFPDPPQPPNPILTGAMQTATNIGTGITGSYLNNYNQVTPQGSLTYEPHSTYSYTDPVSQQVYQIPRWTATQTGPQPGSPYYNQYQESLSTGYNLGRAGTEASGDLRNIFEGPNTNFLGQADQWAPAGDPSQLSTLNAAAYLRANPDVAAWAQASGMDPAAAARQHYQQFGASEGRSGFGADPSRSFNSTLDVQSYLRNNPDVAQFARANGLDPSDFARQHYQQYGIGEGREGSGAGLQRSLGDYGSQQMGFGDVGSQQYDFGEAGDITRSYGPEDNFSADRARVEESLYGRLNPQLQRDRSNLEQRLADQGIRYGSDAYNRAMDDYNRQSTDARLAVTAAGGTEQQRMNDMAAQRAGFQNAAQQQAYQQAMGRGTFRNTAQQAAYEQAMGRGKFANEAQAKAYEQKLGAANFGNMAQKDAFTQEAMRAEFGNAGLGLQMQQRQQQINAQNARRNQYLTEQYADRNQRLNEISALQSGSQVQAPNFVNTGTTNIPTTDYAGLINNRFSQDMGVYQQQNSNINQIVGGIFGAAGGIMKSDRREKENIDKIGTVFAAGPDGEKPLPIYEYDYKRNDPDGVRHIGPMAQDVEKIDRRAVKTRGGIKYIDKTKLGSILKAA